MGLDNSCNTGLVLGLGLTSSSSSPPPPCSINNTTNPVPSKPLISSLNPEEPSLTLSLSGESFKKSEESPPTGDHQICRQASNSHSGTLSSFSTGRVKRERDVGFEEAEVEKVISSSRVSDEDEDAGTNTRKKLRLTKEQSALLEESFKQHSTLNPKQKQALARQLNLRPRQVEVWFQNRRARTKLKQTEVDCEFLKKCCETLSDENRRLQKELQELRALKLSQPFYMHMPAATLTMCPSCERIGGGGGGGSGDPAPGKSAFSKTHFYNSFTNPSAAC